MRPVPPEDATVCFQPKLPKALLDMRKKASRKKQGKKVAWNRTERRRVMESLGRYFKANSEDAFGKWQSIGRTSADDERRNNWLSAVLEDPVAGLLYNPDAES